MDYIPVITYVNKYKERLNAQSDVKKILHALQKLNNVDMTIDILQKTEVGKAVNKLKKIEGIGNFAKEIVIKWKKLLSIPKYKPPSSDVDYNSSMSASNNSEYDPTQNWEMGKQKHKKTSDDEDEYDPTQNWEMKMENSSKHHKQKKTSYAPVSSKKKKHKSNKERLNASPKFVDSPSPSMDYKNPYNDNVIESGIEEEHMEESGSDNNYPSSREDFPTSYNDAVPSVTSETVSYNNYSADGNELDEKVTDKFRKVKKMINHKSSVEANHKSHLKHSKSKHKNSVIDSTKKKIRDSSPNQRGDSPSTSTKKNFKESKSSNNKKRKAEENTSTSTIKKKTSEKEKTESKPAKRSKVEKDKSSDISFEQFMMMDTSKVKKKKKKTKPDHRTSSSLPKGERSRSKPKVDLHLPEIKSTYHPLPALPQAESRHLPSQPDALTDEIAAALHTQRNSKRMQVYSGQKGNFLPKMISLYDQCMNVLLNNIDKLDVIGVPFEIIKPVLERCTVEQLYRLEDSNPYLLEDTGDLWMKHAIQDFRSHKPNEMESWREMYLRLYDAREEKLARLTHSIQAKVNKAKPLAKRTKLAYVGVGQAKAPRNVLRAQLKYGTAGKKPIPYTPSSSKSRDSASSSAADIKQQVADIRLSVPIGTITASTVDNMASNSRIANMKKQPPRAAPMMAKTLKSINKLRYRR